MNYKHGIVRRPGESFINGLTTVDLGLPDIDKTLEQHNRYCEALRNCGVEVTVLSAMPNFPDAPFVEDTAVVTETCIVITRPGDKSRRGEEETIKELFQKERELEFIVAPGTIDGGDVLRIGNHFYTGLSKRTNVEGASQLARILSKYGFTSSTISVTNVLHLKTGITSIDGNNLIATSEFAALPDFRSFNIIEVSAADAYAANCLLVNESLLIPDGFPRVAERVKTLGYRIIELEMTEFQKMDGGLTCLSLLYN